MYVDLCMFRLHRWEKFTVEVLGVTETEEVTQLHIKKYIQECQRIGREANRTINNNIATLKVFFLYLVSEEFIDEQDNPMRRIRNLKEEKTVIVTFNDDEVSRIINDLKEETYSNVRDKLILIMLFDTGIRVSELCNIKNNDIARRHILIHGKGSKQRLVYISNIMRKYMRRYEAAVRLSRSRINKILKEHCSNAGVRKEVRCSPHDCRHYFAQKQLRNGIDIYSLSRLMGHFDTQITSKYLRGLEQDDILQIGRLHSPLNGVKIKQGLMGGLK
ncbi:MULTISPECIES: tyrosine-type recombinase/integrase [Paenibacillus]|nr:tyrosine-type recombinase/integrase [Paenibacillus validus]